MKKIITIFLSIILLSFVSASLQQDFTERTMQLELNISEDECSSFEYKLMSRYIKDFVFEIKTTDTNEHFYIIIKENNCSWFVDVIEEYESKADITIIGNMLESELVVEEIKANTLRGKFIKILIKS